MDVIVDGLVWMRMRDLTSRNMENIRRELTIVPRKTTDIEMAEDPEPIFLYEEDDDRGLIGVPRGYYLSRKSSSHEELVQVSYGSKMRAMETRFKAEGPFVEQETAIQALMDSIQDRRWGGVLLRGAPGSGKTIQGIEFARRIGRKTLILVHKEFLLRQWKKRLEWQLPGVRIGLIRQGKCEYDQIEETGKEPDFVIGMLQSLSRDVDGNKYPKAMWTSFGLIISDEVHRVGAGSWAPIIPRFNAAYRLGLTATPSRKDGAQGVFFMHISEITYSSTSKMMMPKLRRVITATKLKPIVRGDYRVSTDKLNSAQVINQIAADDFRSRQIVDDIVKAVAAGRKTLVVSERLEHLRKMSKDLTGALFDMDLPFDPKVDYYTGQWFTTECWEKSGKGHKKGDFKMKTRTEAQLEEAERANVIFATKQMCVDVDWPVVDPMTGESTTIRESVKAGSMPDVVSGRGPFSVCSPQNAGIVGKRRCVDIETASGRHRVVDNDHRMWTLDGWKRASDLIPGRSSRHDRDYLAFPRSIHVEERLIHDFSEDDAWVVGVLIGDGSLSQIRKGVVGLTTDDGEIFKGMNLVLGRHGMFLNETRHQHYAVRSFEGKRGRGVKTWLRKLCEKWDMDVPSVHKRIPIDIMTARAGIVRSVLAGLFDSDGCIDATGNMSFSSSSIEMLEQIRTLMLRLGIPVLGEVVIGKDENGRLNVPRVDRDRLLALIPSRLPRKSSRKGSHDARIRGVSISNRVPSRFMEEVKDDAQSRGVSRQEMTLWCREKGCSSGGIRQRGEGCLETYDLICDKIGSKGNMPRDVVWDPVVHVCDAGHRDVGDFSVPPDRSWLFGGSVVHNCEEGLDITASDVLVMATPISDIVQLVGRVQRWCFPEDEKCKHLCAWRAGKCKGKPDPIVVDVIDDEIPQLRKKWVRRQSFYRKNGAMR